MPIQVAGTLPEIICNDSGRYEGDLRVYAKIVFNEAKNIRKPYHNFRHMFHVVWLCYQAIVFYGDRISKRNARNLLVAALFHDFDHSGKAGNDSENIELAIHGFNKHILAEDRPFQKDISFLIMATQYPHLEDPVFKDFLVQIIRDADLSQALSVAWFQQVVVGLATEWDKQEIEVLKGQVGFLAKLQFHTRWAREMFPQNSINEKIAETQDWIEILQ